ncbi:Hypothetical predicted protein [Octopus vulgaris]|uniref:Uncharacterized protein n=1 Tax=Octopus vulgaris TaxID=6645 RepID=A0AA36F2K9_OCTVU|nr:Hypothetical predicted protein [Octopus vulgaris]
MRIEEVYKETKVSVTCYYDGQSSIIMSVKANENKNEEEEGGGGGGGGGEGGRGERDEGEEGEEEERIYAKNEKQHLK